LRAHMHLRGKAFTFRAIYPSGATETLARNPALRFQLAAVLLSGESEISAARHAHWKPSRRSNNSPNNPANPNPSATVLWGPQNWDEMMIGWFDVAVPDGNLKPGGRNPISE